MSGESSSSKDTERQPLLSKTSSLGGTTQKEKYPAKRKSFTDTPSSQYQSIPQTYSNDINNGRATSSTMAATAAGVPIAEELADTTHEEQNRMDQCRFKLFIILLIILTFSFLTSLSILLIAPGFAQKKLENGFQLTFKEASILNITATESSTDLDGNHQIITMHVLGSITLLDSAYSLTNKISNVFGDIQLLNTSLEVYHQPIPSPSSPSSFSLFPSKKKEKRITKKGIMENKEEIILPLSSSSALPMGILQLPTLILSQDSNTTEFDFITQFIIQDTNHLIDFCKDALSSKLVGWKVKGNLPIDIGWLPFQQQLSLDKIIQIEGMDGLKKSELNNIVFPGKHPVGGIALEGTVGVYNPSKTLSMNIGDVNFGIYLPNEVNMGEEEEENSDVMIAVIKAKDTRLIGEKMNYFSVMGRTLTLDDKDMRKKKLMENFLTNYLHGNTSIVHVRGSLFGPDQQPTTLLSYLNYYHQPTWLERALSSITLSLPFPGTKQMDIIKSLTLENIKIDFSMITHTPLISGDAISFLQLPDEMQISLTVLEIEPKVYLYLEEDASQPFAYIHPNQPCPSTTIQPGNDDTIPIGMFKVISIMKKAPFKVIPGREKDYQKFLDKVFNGEETTLYFNGKANALVENDFGRLNVRDLDFKGHLSTKGMEGMKSPPPKVTSMSITKGYKDALQVKTTFVLNNPSNISMNLGLVTFSMLHNGVKIGNATIQQLDLKKEADNQFEATGYIFSPALSKNPSSILEFIGGYISGDSTELEISGQDATSSIYLAPLLNQLRFDIQLPTFDEIPLLKDVQMNLLSSTAIVWLRNPFEYINMEIIQINATAIYETTSIGTMFADFKDGGKGWKGPIQLPPIQCQPNHHPNDNHEDDDTCNGFTVETPRIPVMLKNKIITWEPISKALGGKIQVAIDSMVTVKIDSFLLSGLDYKRNNITAIIKKSF
ncbi:unnamed protein product [Cunninghamella blakesleeana]